MTYRKIDIEKGRGMLLWVSKSKVQLGKTFQIRLRVQPPIESHDSDQVDISRVFVESGKRVAAIKKSYNRLCRHYDLPLEPGTAEGVLEVDDMLSPVDREKCTSFAKIVKVALTRVQGYSHVSPRIIAGICVGRMTSDPWAP
jgi:hypothetical protein